MDIIIKMMHICMFKNYIGHNHYTHEIIEGSDIGNIWFNEHNYMKIIDMHGINFRNKNFRTVLIWACDKKKIEIVRKLLGMKGIDVNFQDANGETALTWGCMHGSVEIVKLLLKADDIDVNLLGNDGKTALMHACGNVEIIKLLEDFIKIH